MSLKAKIEAVIYASEEPVTLAQLTGLLGLEGQMELDHLESQQQDLALEDGSAMEAASVAEVDEDALNAEVMDVAEGERAPANAPTNAMDARQEYEGRDAVAVAEDFSDSGAASGVTETKADPVVEEKAAAAEAARLAKLKERRLREYFRELLDELMSDYANGDRGLEVREVAGGFRLATKPEYHDAVRGFVKNLKPPMKLTLQALETLAVVAYKQPVTAPEVSEIRGVDSAGVMGSLIARKLVTTAGRKQVIGRPILYKTTKDFLLRFGLKDINELPSIEEFEKMAGELNEAVQEEIQMETSQEADSLEGELAVESSADGGGASDRSMSAAADHLPNTIATPEGDNELPPDVPLTTGEPAPLRPNGDEPHSVMPLQDTEDRPKGE